MKQYRALSWAAVASLLLLAVACSPASAPVDVGQAASTAEPSAAAADTPTNQPPTLPAATAAATATSLPSTQPPAAPIEASPAPTGMSSPSPSAVGQGNADVLHVRAVQAADPAVGSGQGSTWTFHVTVEHPDTGWEDYADGWDVVTPDGTVLKPDPDSPFTRLLLHPHETEQPFTRSQGGIVIPEGVTQVTVRAHDLANGFGGREILVELTIPAGEGFEVERNP